MSRSVDELLARGHALNSPNYAPADIIFERGDGVWLTDSTGTRYLDFVAGIAVCALGHAHPRLSEALHDQVDRLLHVSNMYFTQEQIELMERLVERSFADRVFFCNSGAEANEAAFKLARRYQSKIADAPEKTKILSMKSSFHGRTLAAITATGQPKYHDGFAPLAPRFEYTPFNNTEALHNNFDDTVGAVIVEPIQGEGGIRPARQEFLRTARTLCDEHGALLIYDEVQTGVGRTGSMFAYQHYGVTPDIMSLAKGLGGGVPVAATLATEEVWQGWKRGSHASTFGGNPLATRAGKIVLDVIDDEDLLDNAHERGQQLRDGLRALADDFGNIITDVRGTGLMVGAECGNKASEIVDRARDEGLLINTAGGDTLRFVPPLIISADHVDQAVERLRRALERC